MKKVGIALLLLLLAGCGRPAFRGAAKGEFPLVERSVRPEEVKDFSKLFDLHCQGCHGANGRKGPAPSLNDPLFLAIVPESELRLVIINGRKNTLMPAFAKTNGGPLTADQVEVLVSGIRSEWTRAESSEGVPQYLASGKGDSDEGQGVYAMNCAACHGDKGEGKPGVAGALNDAAFLALTSDQMLRRIVITGRPDLGIAPGLGMPDYKTRDPKEFKNFKPLKDQDVSNVVAFLAAWRKQAGR